MLPQVSENLHSILIAIGLFLVGYALYDYRETSNEHYSVVKSTFNIHGLMDSVRFEKRINKLQSGYLLRSIYDRYDIKERIAIDDTAFVKKIDQLTVDVHVKDSLELIYLHYLRNAKVLSIVHNNTAAKHEYLRYVKNKPTAYIWTSLIIGTCGFAFLLIGYYGIQKQQLLRDKILLHQQSSLSVDVVRCQSCGKRFSSMIRYGKEKNGKLSKSFCNSCYHNGKFTEPDLTFVQMKNRSLYSDDVNFFKRRKVARILKKLDRWNNDHYEDIFDRL